MSRRITDPASRSALRMAINWRVAWLAVLAGVSLHADEMLPKQWSCAHQGTVREAAVPGDAEVWKEFGLAASESAAYSGAGLKTTVTAYRLKDTSGALAAWEYLRPADGRGC